MTDEEWEENRRKELEETLEDGYYQIGEAPFIIGTGKGGYIQFKLAVEREFRKQLKNNNPKPNEV